MVFWKREILVRGSGNKQLRIKEKAIPETSSRNGLCKNLLSNTFNYLVAKSSESSS